MKLEEIRRDYLKGSLDKEHLLTDPVAQFNNWFEDALNADIPDANAMTLATADAYGKPSARIILLKGFDINGFRFFTNFSSRKGAHLEVNNSAALLFFWSQLERQVRIEGTVQPVPEEEARAYFDERPYESRISALSSPQSQPIPDREYLVKNVDENIRKFDKDNVPKPWDWGGYRLVPDYFEFWQGRPNRLHDRFRYTLVDGVWKINRLAP